MTNIGLVLLQKDSKYCASFFVIFCVDNKSDVIFPPMGYPHKKPHHTATEPSLETLKRRQNMGEVMLTNICIAGVLINKLESIRNGRSVGSTV